jgi:hypothetical protein
MGVREGDEHISILNHNLTEEEYFQYSNIFFKRLPLLLKIKEEYPQFKCSIIIYCGRSYTLYGSEMEEYKDICEGITFSFEGNEEDDT